MYYCYTGVHVYMFSPLVKILRVKISSNIEVFLVISKFLISKLTGWNLTSGGNKAEKFEYLSHEIGLRIPSWTVERIETQKLTWFCKVRNVILFKLFFFQFILLARKDDERWWIIKWEWVGGYQNFFLKRVLCVVGLV